MQISLRQVEISRATLGVNIDISSMIIKSSDFKNFAFIVFIPTGLKKEEWVFASFDFVGIIPNNEWTVIPPLNCVAAIPVVADTAIFKPWLLNISQITFTVNVFPVPALPCK